MTDEARTKHRRVVDYLDSAGLDGVLLTRRCNFAWYTCGAHNHVAEACDVGASSLLVTRDGAKVLANNIEAARLAGEELPDPIEVVEYPYHDARARQAALARVMTGRFAADAPVEGPSLPALGGDFDRLRWRLTEPEIDRLRGLCRDASAAVEGAAGELVRGMTENAIAGLLAQRLRQRNCLPWVLLVACDERIGLYRHPLPTDKRLQRHAMLVVVAERTGLMSAVTRLACFGGPDDDLRRRHQAAATVDAALVAATRPGATLGEIFTVGQQAYAAAGFPDEWRRHHQGGSIGYLPREVKAAPGCPVEVLADQPFAWNPSVAGTKCEDTVLCRPGGCEVLTGSADWPVVRVTWQGATFTRPDILAL